MPGHHCYDWNYWLVQILASFGLKTWPGKSPHELSLLTSCICSDLEFGHPVNSEGARWQYFHNRRDSLVIYENFGV